MRRIVVPSPDWRGAPPGDQWEALQASLTRWVACRTRPPIDARDIASEVVVRGIAALGVSCAVAWPSLLAWGITTAGRLLVDGARRSKRVGFELRQDLDAMIKRAESVGGGEHNLLEQLMLQASGTDRLVLQRMLEGLLTSNAIAAAIGRSVRAIELSRQRLRRLGESIMRGWLAEGESPAGFGVERLVRWRQGAATKPTHRQERSQMC